MKNYMNRYHLPWTSINFNETPEMGRTFLMQVIQRLRSYMGGYIVADYRSPLNGTLEVTYANGRLILNAEHANYSYDTLHQVFRKALRSIPIRSKPPEQTLILGFGGGSVATILAKEWKIPTLITGVEHDPIVIDIAHTHFDIGRLPNLRLVNEDAADWMAANRQQFGLVVVDLFRDDQVPEQFTALPFLQQLHDSIKPGGYLVFNFMCGTGAEKARFAFMEDFFRKQQGKTEVLYIKGWNQLLLWEAGFGN